VSRVRRWVVTLGVALAIAVAWAVPAQAGDLDDYLERAADADYTGRRVVVTTWDGRTEAEIVEVTRVGGVVMIAGPTSDIMIGEGKVAMDGAGGVALAVWSAPAAGDKYTATEVGDVTRLGRPARSVTIYEGTVVRARIIFDVATWVPLVTEIYDGDGDLFRVAAFTDLEEVPGQAVAAVRNHEGDAYDVVPRVDNSTLPETAAGYQRLDTYLGADGIAHGFYGDGLFSFSVFVVPAVGATPQLDGGDVRSLAGHRYGVVVEAHEVWVSWRHGRTGYILVGDLPPDHLELVLDDLPAPKAPNLLERFFDLFG